MASILLQQCPILVFLASHPEMVGKDPARPALLSFAGHAWAYKSINRIVLGVLYSQGIIMRIFLGGVLGVALGELELSLALAAADQFAAHLANSLGVEHLVFLLPNNGANLL
jgi:hypothetical protein